MTVLERLGDCLWSPGLLGLFLAAGLYLTVKSGFFQIFGAGRWMGGALTGLLGGRKGNGRGLTRAQALSTALASTIGTGSIAGVATAIFFGGPGAVFWMWVSAFLGMMTGFVEKALAVRWREKGPDGAWRGGPMCYIARGLGSPFLAAWFALACAAASLMGGNLVQSNSIAASLEAAFGWDRLAVGVVTAALTGAVILGGVGRIGKVSQALVPAMALLFLGGGVLVLFCHRAAIPGALERIVACALSPQAALGGGAGYGLAAALRYGVARGVFTNEAGMGTSAIAHAASETEDPVQEGLMGMFEVFFATLAVCTVTALVILTSGVYGEQAALAAIRSGAVEDAMLGAPLSAAAFSTVLGSLGAPFVAVCLLLFAFTSLLGCSYYGERCLAWLTGSDRWRGFYRLAFLAMVVWSAAADVQVVWQLTDLFNGLMALPNLCALLALSPQVLPLVGAGCRKGFRRGAPGGAPGSGPAGG